MSRHLRISANSEATAQSTGLPDIRVMMAASEGPGGPHIIALGILLGSVMPIAAVPVHTAPTQICELPERGHLPVDSPTERALAAAVESPRAGPGCAHGHGPRADGAGRRPGCCANRDTT